MALTATLAFASPAAAEPVTQTIVLIRHGEKPPLGLGQLDCQGLNRALALPAVIARQFGKPDFIFAPNPSVAKPDNGQLYDYIRPLATIEPTAIAFGLPVDASIGLDDIEALRGKLEAPATRATLTLVAWEHVELVKLARLLMTAHGADPTLVPEWKYSDFDSVYVITIARTGDLSTITFAHRQQGLNGQPTKCPQNG